MICSALGLNVTLSTVPMTDTLAIVATTKMQVFAANVSNSRFNVSAAVYVLLYNICCKYYLMSDHFPKIHFLAPFLPEQFM